MRTDALSLHAAAPIFEPALLRNASPRPIAAWLLACCALVFAMVVVGGVDAAHAFGSVDRRMAADRRHVAAADRWTVAGRVRQIPGDARVPAGQSRDDVAAFKGIFWWEYFHRLLGRAIGVAFFVPLPWFAVRRRLPPGLATRLGVIFVAGRIAGCDGLVHGAKRIVDDPRVSHFRLTAHLGLALAIFAAMFWVALSLLRPLSTPPAYAHAADATLRHGNRDTGLRDGADGRPRRRAFVPDRVQHVPV